MSEGTERSEVIINSAKLRRDLEINAFRVLMRKLYGDMAYEAELKESADIDRFIRQEPPAPPEVRRRLKRWWGWGKRGR